MKRRWLREPARVLLNAMGDDVTIQKNGRN